MVLVEHEYLEPLISGVQENVLICVNNKIYDIFGFCAGDNTMKFKKLLRGFKNTINEYDIEQNKWKSLGKIELRSRFATASFTHNGKIYIFGGMSYTPLNEKEIVKLGKNLPPKKNIHTYYDAFVLEFREDNVIQKRLPYLPYNSAGSAAICVKNKIYFLGGALYTRGKGYNCLSKVKDGTEIGKTFFSLDLDDIEKGYEIINNFPGLPTFYHNLINYQDKYLFILGGKTNSKISMIKKNGYEFMPMNLYENWKYDISKNEWSKISNSTINIVGYSSVLYKDKIICLGGVRYKNTKIENKEVDSDLVIPNEKTYKYGRISDLRAGEKIDCAYVDGYFSNLIIVYDITQDKFEVSPYRLPVNVHRPSITIKDDYIYFGGGEVKRMKVGNKDWTTHPYNFLKINLKNIVGDI